MTTSGKPLAFFSLRLCLALLASMLLHLLIVAGSAGWLPSWLADESDPLEITLADVPPPPKPKPVFQPAIPKPVPKAAPKPAATPTPPEKPVQQDTTPKLQTPEASTQPINQPEPTAEEPAPQPVPEPEQAAEPIAEAPRPMPPKHIELEFLVDYDGASAVEKQRYQVFEDGRYVLSSTVEAKGLLSLALSDLNQKSEGHVTPQGLRPDAYTYQYGSNSKKAQKASFDWAGKNLTMEVGEKKQTAALAEGTQDLLSFLYQFMFTPPLENFQLTVTTGKKLKTYTYAFEGEEELKTKLGNLQTLHIAKSSGNGEEKTEIWLASDYHYLPVKMRKTEANGKVVQSTINSINMTPQP